MERCTFDELKSFVIGDLFYTKQKKFIVDSDPVYYSTSDFYGDSSEKVEWTGICETQGEDYRRQHRFVVQNVHQSEDEREYLIFKIEGEPNE